MTATLTRTYDRNTVVWEQDLLDALVEAGQAKAFPTPRGIHYVVKDGSSSYGVRPEQITAKPDPLEYIPAADDLQALRDIIAEPEPAVVADAWEQKLADEDALLAKFGI